MEDELMHHSSMEPIRDDEPMETVTSVPEPPMTPVKARRRLSESKFVVASSKRMKTKSTAPAPSSMLQNSIRTMEIPHSAILTRVVWVFDEKYQWWPGKVKDRHDAAIVFLYRGATTFIRARLLTISSCYIL
jgi:hypothetical protein